WPPLPAPLIKLHGWLHSYYGAGGGSITQLIVPSFLLSTQFKEFTRDEGTTSEKPNLPPLTDEQTAVLHTIQHSIPPTTHLLHGITGSGKTRVYAEAAREVLNAGHSVIMLVPE